MKPAKEPPPPLPAIQPTRGGPRQAAPPQQGQQAAGGRKQGKYGKASAGLPQTSTPRAIRGGSGANNGRGGGSYGGGFSYSWPLDEDDYTEEAPAPRSLDLGAFFNLPGAKQPQVGHRPGAAPGLLAGQLACWGCEALALCPCRLAGCSGQRIAFLLLMLKALHSVDAF